MAAFLFLDRVERLFAAGLVSGGNPALPLIEVCLRTLCARCKLRLDCGESFGQTFRARLNVRMERPGFARNA